MAEEKQEFVRILYTDIPGTSTLLYGLARIKGISYMFSNALCHVLKFDPNKKISSLTEKEIETLESYLSGEEKKGIPGWLLNTQKDPVSGKDLHIAVRDLDYYSLQLKRRNSKAKTYRTLRTRLGLTVRGQRTKGNFRRFAKKKGAGGRK